MTKKPEKKPAPIKAATLAAKKKIKVTPAQKTALKAAPSKKLASKKPIEPELIELEIAGSYALEAESNHSTEFSENLIADESFVRNLSSLLIEGHDAQVREQISGLHPADIAYVLDMLSAESRHHMMVLLGDDFDPATLENLEHDVACDVLAFFGPERAGKLVAELEPDEAVWVLEDMEDDLQRAILDALPAEKRQKVEEGLSYPDSSVGRLMQKRIVLVPEFWTVGNTIDYMRSQPNLPDEFYSVFVVDARNRPVGTLLVSKVLRAKRHEKIRSLMNTELRVIPASMDQEEAALLFQKYNLVSAPVVHPNGRILGMITIEDIIDVIEEEADEDLLSMGGISAGQDINTGASETVKRRFPWLFVNMITAVMSVTVITHFQGAIQHLVALAALMPVVASLGGNAGTQTMTVTVRALANRELTGVNIWRVVFKELAVSMMHGAMFAALAMSAVMVWQRDWYLGMVLGIAIMGNLLCAGLAGVSIPYLLSRMRADPAISSGVFLTAITDAMGFFAFLGLATIFLLS
ncbi:magnesium transporter [bacterium]|nr:magnesium transporter [bacterium]